MEDRTSSDLSEIFRHIEKNSDNYVKDLKEHAGIKNKDKDTETLLNWIEKKVKELDGEIEICKIEKIPWHPYVLFVNFDVDEDLKTLCVYAHIKVNHENDKSFIPFEADGKLHGGGILEGVSPVLTWIHVVESLKTWKKDLPLNIKLVFGGLGKYSSLLLEQILERQKKAFFSKIDYVCLAGGHWLGHKKPCVLYGHRGICYFNVDIRGGERTELHSGTYGGVVYEPMTDVLFLLNCLTDANGKILVPGILDDVRPINVEENKSLCKLDFDVEEFKKLAGVSCLLHQGKKSRILTHMTRLPSLSIHGIETDIKTPGMRCVIPLHVVGKFSIRLVEDQNPEKIVTKIVAYLEEIHRRRESPNILTVETVISESPWVGSSDGKNVTAARNAMRAVYGLDPDLTRYGGSVSSTFIMERITGKAPVVIPICGPENDFYGTDEKIDVKEYINGHKVLAAYICNIIK